ncbi:MAG: hypothetical protein GC164_14290 [Phycisphaera sp.]|nr:hypothetical protein [Phycisphaera sp.]
MPASEKAVRSPHWRTSRPWHPYRHRCDTGSTFILALWLIAALTALALSLAYGSNIGRQHAANMAARAQVRQTELAALRYVVRGLTDTDGLLPTDTQMPCCAMQVGDCAFWVIRADDEGDGKQHYGLLDESGHIDLSTAPLEVLERLPDITSEIAAAIVDWRDADETTTEGGAESDFYLRQPIPYNASNSPFESTEELRMVAGVTDAILWGEDTNRNGMLDAWENDGDTSAPSDDGDGILDRGLAGWTSGFVRWPTQQSNSEDSTINVNTSPRSRIEQTLLRYVEPSRAIEITDQIATHRPMSSIFQLYYTASLTKDEFESLEPVLVFTTQANRFRLNLNAAPAAVIACLPGLTDSDAQALLAARLALGGSGQSLSWALDVIDKDRLIEATGAGVVGRGYQYSADIVCVTANGRAFSRAKYVIDARNTTPRVVWRQDLTARGWPLDPTILDRLRSGEELETVLADDQQAAGL